METIYFEDLKNENKKVLLVEKEFRRLNGRVYFNEKKKDIDNEFINKYKEKH
ncbi:MAG: hypothetical protein IJC07_03600 [Clostridia bacterium]|nr:hypothetical protein [Clostridia bacterium]